MTQELTQSHKADVCALHAKLTEARETINAIQNTPYMARGSANAVIDGICKLQDDLLKIVISGELPMQPVRVDRSFIGMGRAD